MTSPWPAAWPKSKKPSSYGKKWGEQIIMHLHKKEMELREDIWNTQVTHWSKAKIKERFGT